MGRVCFGHDGCQLFPLLCFFSAFYTHDGIIIIAVTQCFGLTAFSGIVRMGLVLFRKDLLLTS